MAERNEFYQPKQRFGHCAIVVQNEVFIWGGWQLDVPRTNENIAQLSSYVDVFKCIEGRWQQHHTHGHPPPGVAYCASCYVSNNIYFFGGESNDGSAYNCVHSLNTDIFRWRELLPTNDRGGPKKKRHCGMIVGIDGNIMIFGGKCNSSLTLPAELTNEHHLFNLGAAEWMVPSVSGDIPPPISTFTLTKYSSDKAVMFGGRIEGGDHSSTVRVVTIGRNNIHWEELHTEIVNRPMPSLGDAATCITCSLMGQLRTQLLVVGGIGPEQYCSVLDIEDAVWRKVTDIPDFCLHRQYHTISAIATTEDCAWVIAVGGNSTIHPAVTLFELNRSLTGLWELGIVLHDGYIYTEYQSAFLTKFPSKFQTQPLVTGRREGKLEQQLQMATRQVEQLQANEQLLQEEKQKLLKNKEQQLQDVQQQLQDALQQVEQLPANEQLLHEEKQKLKDKEQKLQDAQQQLEAQRNDAQKKSEELEMVKKMSQAKSSEILQKESQISQMESQLKACIEGKSFELEQATKTISQLQAQLLTKDKHISNCEAKLQASEATRSKLDEVKVVCEEMAFENQELKEQFEMDIKALSYEKNPADTRDCAIQADYLSVTSDSVLAAEQLAETVLEVVGGKHQTLKWSNNGFRLTVPADAVPAGTTISLAVKSFLEGEFELPENSQLVSAIYWIAASQELNSSVTLYLQHCAVIESEAQSTEYQFVVGKCSQPNLPYLLKIKKGGMFTPHSQEAFISVKQFSFYAAVGPKNSKSSYYEQAFYRPVGGIYAWQFEYLITRYIQSQMEWVKNEYEKKGWSQHHEQVLQFKDPADDSSSITLDICEPANEQERKWHIQPLGAPQIMKWRVDQFKKRMRVPHCRLAIKWRGEHRAVFPDVSRRVDLEGAQSPCDHFSIELPEQIPLPLPSAQASSSRPKKRSASPGNSESASKRVHPADNLEDTVQVETGPAVGHNDAKIRSNTTTHNLAPSNASPSTPSGPMTILDGLPEGILGPSHLPVVLFYIDKKGMTAKWRKIGIYLNLLYSDLEMIEANHAGEDNRIMAMLNQWLKSGKATKDSLLRVLNMI